MARSRTLARRAIQMPVMGAGGAPAISVSPSSWDFGATPVGTPVSKIFTIQNTGTGTLEITLPITIVDELGDPVDGFTVTVDPDTSIAPGDDTTFTVQADADEVETLTANIKIVSNAASSPTLVAIEVNVEIDYLLDDATLTAVAAYSTRLLRRQYAGQCLRLRRSSDNAESDFGFTSQGVLDTAAITTWLGGANGLITKQYDQSGNGRDRSQATAASQSLLVQNVQNGLSIARFDGVDDVLSNTSFADFGDAYTMLCVIAFSSSGDTSQGVFEVSNGTTNTGFSLNAFPNSTWQARDAGANRTVAGSDIRDNVFRIHSAHNTGSGLQYWQNQISIGTSVYTAPNPNTMNRLDVGGLVSPAGAKFKGDMAELILFGSQLSTPVREEAEDNMNNAYELF